MLQGIVDRGIAHQVEIHYNTNGTQWPEKAEAIWQHFRTVEIAFSIDDLEQRFEYQRTNAVWSEVTKNIAKFRDLRSRHKNIQLQVCSTINIFNIWNLEKISNWIDQQSFDFIYWNMLHEAKQYSIASLPPESKQTAKKILESANVSEFHRREFRKVIDFMLAGHSLSSKDLLKEIKKLDQRRSQDLRNYVPELAESLNYEGS